MAPARAAIVVADFDPAYGPAIPNLGFKGSANFFVSDTCLSQSGLVSNFAPCSDNTMSVLSAQVNFYNLASPSTTIATINYGASAFEVFTAFISNGEVLGVDTNIGQAAPVTISAIGPNPISFEGLMSLFFFTGLTELNSPSTGLPVANASNPVSGIGGVKLFANCEDYVGRCDVFSSQSATASVVYATIVPEPSAGWLGLLGLGVLAARLRKKA